MGVGAPVGAAGREQGCQEASKDAAHSALRKMGTGTTGPRPSRLKDRTPPKSRDLTAAHDGEVVAPPCGVLTMKPSAMTSLTPAPMTALQFEVEACHLDSAELWDGRMLLREPAGWPGTGTNARLVAIVGQHLMAAGKGLFFESSAGFLLRRNPDRVLAPDLAVIVDETQITLPKHGFPELTPDLVAEVRSPGDSWEYVLSRGGLWLAHGVKVVWLIDPMVRRAVELRQDRAPVILAEVAPAEAEGVALDGAPVLPDLRVPLAQLFRGLP